MTYQILPLRSPNRLRPDEYRINGPQTGGGIFGTRDRFHYLSQAEHQYRNWQVTSRSHSNVHANAEYQGPRSPTQQVLVSRQEDEVASLHFPHIADEHHHERKGLVRERGRAQRILTPPPRPGNPLTRAITEHPFSRGNVPPRHNDSHHASPHSPYTEDSSNGVPLTQSPLDHPEASSASPSLPLHSPSIESANNETDAFVPQQKFRADARRDARVMDRTLYTLDLSFGGPSWVSTMETGYSGRGTQIPPLDEWARSPEVLDDAGTGNMLLGQNAVSEEDGLPLPLKETVIEHALFHLTEWQLRRAVAREENKQSSEDTKSENGPLGGNAESKKPKVPLKDNMIEYIR